MTDYGVYFEATLDADESHYVEDFIKKVFQEKGWKAYNFLIAQHEVTEELTFEQELTDLLNRHSTDSEMDAPDWALATYILTMLNAVKDLNDPEESHKSFPNPMEDR